MRTAIVRGAVFVTAGIVHPAAGMAQTAARTEPSTIEVTVEAPRDGVTRTTAGPVKGWQALSSTAATKIETPLVNLPQAVTVLPRQAIEAQGAVSQSEALRNVSAVQPAQTTALGQVFPTVRGFSAERFVDGLPNYYDNGERDGLVNVERVEVLKGPASILYQGGPNPVGGVVNVVSKMPTLIPSYQFGLVAGGYGKVNPWFDLNLPVTKDGTALFRVTGSWERTETQIDGQERRSYEINPTLVFSDKETTTLTLQARISRREQKDYPGLPAVGTLDRSVFKIDPSLFPAERDLPTGHTDYKAVTARIDHTFNDVWSAFATVRASRSNFDEPAQFVLSQAPAVPPSTFVVWNGFLGERNTEVSANANLVGKFDYGPLKNRVLFGADVNRVTDVGRLDAAPAGFVDFTNPNFPDFVRPIPGPFTTFTDIDNVYVQRGLTAQWQASLWERVHVLTALRLANVNIRSQELTTASAFHTDETKVLPRLGASIEVVKGVSVFADYTEGLRAVPFFNGATAPRPQQSRQTQGGVKLDMPYGLSATFALFDLRLTDVPTANPNVPGQQIQTGEQRSRGFEADMLWQPNANWSFIGSYARVDARYTRNTVIAEGNVVEGVPRDSGRLWGTYRVTDGPLAGLSAGAGLYASSRVAITNANEHFAPGFATFDGRLAYDRDTWSVALTGKNLTDRFHWVRQPYFDGRVAPGEGRTVYLSLTARM